MRQLSPQAGDTDPSARAAPLWRALTPTLVWALIYLGVGELALLTRLPHQPLLLATPAAGVLVLWFAMSSRRALPWDLAALAVVSVVGGAQLGLPPLLMALSGVPPALQALVFLLVMNRRDGVAPFGARAQWRIRDLGIFLTASLLSTLVMAGVSAASVHLAGLPSGDLGSLLLRWGRSAAATMALGALGLFVLPGLRQAWRQRQLGAWWAERAAVARQRAAEGTALVAMSLALSLVCFWVLADLPVTFLMLMTTAWVGIRFSPAVAAAHTVGVGCFAVLSTLGGHGALAALIDDPVHSTLVAQLFVVVVAATALSLSISREQLMAAEQLAETRLRLLDQVLFEVDDGIVVIEETGRVVLSNPAAKLLFGTAGHTERMLPGEVYGLHDRSGHPALAQHLPFARALAGEKVEREDFELRAEDGSVDRHLRIGAELMPSLGAAQPRRVLLTIHDITRDRLHQDALATFAGHVAHDLRNPLSVVEAWNEMLADDARIGLPVPATDVLDVTAKIGSASRRMRDFIKGLLDYTLARDRALKQEPVDLSALATEVAEMRATAMPGREPPQIRVLGAGTALADPTLLRIVVDNLLANACKYVPPERRPEVLVTVEEREPGTVELSVVDNGIGIPCDQRERVFESFHRVEGTGHFEGTGQGLGICRRIVERHGGRIWIADATQGACVKVLLPAALRTVSSGAGGELVA